MSADTSKTDTSKVVDKLASLAGTTRPTRRAGCIGLTALVVVLAFVTCILTVILVSAIWPGEAKLTASLLCPDDKPDTYVVTDTYSAVPGETSYNFTLYCVGPRGEVSNEGFLRPFLVLWLGHAALLAAIAGLVVLRRRVRE